MILSVVQPSYFLPFNDCAKILISDVVVWADSFSFSRHSTINRTRIKTAAGAKWLTVPVHHTGGQPLTIKQARVDNHSNWSLNHIKVLKNNYINAPYYYSCWDELEHLFQGEWQTLNDLLLRTFIFALDHLNIRKKIIPSSSLAPVRDRTKRVITWLEAAHCDCYLVEIVREPLVNLEKINNAGFKMKLFSLSPITYHQQFGPFLFPLSILDLLFNEGEFGRKVVERSIVDKYVGNC